MNTFTKWNGLSQTHPATLARALIAAGFLFFVFSGQAQTAPVLTITPLGTNQFSISFTNYPASTWDLQWTPVLANPNYQWTTAAPGTNGQTNFIVTTLYPAGFYRAVLDTNTIPLWAAADPNNPGAGYLAVFIDSPTNGAALQ